MIHLKLDGLSFLIALELVVNFLLKKTWNSDTLHSTPPPPLARLENETIENIRNENNKF